MGEGYTDFLDPTAWVVSGGGGGVTSEHVPDAGGNDDQYGFMDLTLAQDKLIVDAISHTGVLRRKMVIEPEYPHNPHFKLHTKESKTEAEKDAPLQDGDEGHNSRRKERQNGDDDDDDDDKVGDDKVSHGDEHKDEEKDEPKRGGHVGKGGARKDGDKSDEDMHDEKVSI